VSNRQQEMSNRNPEDAVRTMAMDPFRLRSVLLEHRTGEMSARIKQYDRLIQQLNRTEYPETQALLTVRRWA
jgi:hypothetical protein